MVLAHATIAVRLNESADERALDARRMVLFSEHDGSSKGNLVHRTPTGLPSATLAAQVGIVDLNLLAEDILRLAFGHRLHQLVVDEPCSRQFIGSWRLSGADKPVLAPGLSQLRERHRFMTVQQPPQLRNSLFF